MAEMDYQTARSELIAIYRLEFYKNKKNWKLCSDVRKSPPLPLTPKSKNTFNQTYDVQLDAELDPEPPLNQAFLNEVPVDEPYPEPYHEPLLGTPAQTPSLGQAWPSQHWMEPEDQEAWCGGDAEGAPDTAACHHCDSTYPRRLWPPEVEQCSAAECSRLQQLEHASPEELLALAEDWLRRQGFREEPDPAYCDQYPLDSDSMEFVRGAHLVPHSSETDLSITHDECVCTSLVSLRTASASRLVRALRPHAAALRHILAELDTREHMRPASPFPPLNLLEERPTRDTDPPHAHERLLAGSRTHTPTLPTPKPAPSLPTHATPTPSAGRGRGRGRLIGLKMGRPYRL